MYLKETTKRLRCMNIIDNKKKAPIPNRITIIEKGSSFTNTAFVETKETPQRLIEINAYNEAVNLPLKLAILNIPHFIKKIII
jgi:hypothetical protein